MHLNEEGVMNIGQLKNIYLKTKGGSGLTSLYQKHVNIYYINLACHQNSALIRL